MNNILQDRFTRGFIAGLLAGICGALVWNLISRYVLHFATLSYWDFAAGIIFRKAISNMGEAIYSFFTVKLFFALLGIIFAFLTKNIRSNLLIFKGWIFGVTLWFFIYSMIAIYKIPILTNTTPQTCCSHFIEASVWGVMSGYFLNLLNKKSACP